MVDKQDAVAHNSKSDNEDKPDHDGWLFRGPNRRRFMFNVWTRDPNGCFFRNLTGTDPDLPSGKRHPSGLLWGDDLDSFFTGRPQPHNPHYISYFTRSMLQEFGENFWKQPEIDEEEPNPKLLSVYPMLSVPLEPVEPDIDSDDEYIDGMKVIYTSIPLYPSAWSSLRLVTMADEKKFGLPKLEEFIPDVYFPDVLIVHDQGDLLLGHMSKSDDHKGASVVEYRRVWPVFERDHFKGDPFALDRDVSKCPAGWRNRTGHLQFSAARLIGEGHHSLVYRAPLKLPGGLRSRSPTHSGQVTVAAKLAKPLREARNMLRNEAWIYSKFPKHLMEDWSGYVLALPERFPVPADAVVPKFYGYYVPYNIDPKISSHSIEDLSPILLLEECGTEVETSKMSLDERSQCYTHVIRLYKAGFMHKSTYMRNIVAQPGPLCVHPSERSMACPAFRIIDFGRGEWVEKWYKDKYKDEYSKLPAYDKLTVWYPQWQPEEKAVLAELGMDPDKTRLDGLPT